MYIIKDWAGNILNYNGRFERPELAVAMVFEEFDHASDWLSDTYGNLDDAEYEATLGDLFIEPK